MKDGYRVKLKGGGLGKKLFKTKAAAQKQSRGPPKGAKPKGKPKATSKAVTKSTGSNPSPATTGGGGKKKPKLGSTYSATKASFTGLSPAGDEVARAIVNRTIPSEAELRASLGRIKAKALTVDYGLNLAVIAVDAVVDKKTAHATALTMGSGSAWAPEVYLWIRAFQMATARKDVREMHALLTILHQGYNPATGIFEGLKSDDFKIYRGLRHGGQLVRKARSKFRIVRKITEPVAKIAKAFGGRF